MGINEFHGLESLDYTVTQAWTSDEVGMAIHGQLDDCIVKHGMKEGLSEDREGVCVRGLFSLTVVVYFDQDFDPEECVACNADDLPDMGGSYEFCAYRVEIPCECVDGPRPTAKPTLPST